MAQADTDDVAAVPDDAAGIQWAKTAVVDNESGGPAMVEGSVLWDSPAEQKQNFKIYCEKDRQIGRNKATLKVSRVNGRQ